MQRHAPIHRRDKPAIDLVSQESNPVQTGKFVEIFRDFGFRAGVIDHDDFHRMDVPASKHAFDASPRFSHTAVNRDDDVDWGQGGSARKARLNLQETRL